MVAAIILVGIFGHHKAANKDYIVHDAGWQFQMKLASPLTLDPSLITATHGASK
jgi:hypothetical protein